MKEITAQELAKKRQADQDISIIDVREDFEVAEGIIPGALHIPMNEVSRRRNEIDKEATHYIICRSGARSGRISLDLNGQGYDAYNISGGMIDWAGDIEKRG